MKKTLLFIVLALISIACFSQDIVYLKNGSIIKCRIIEQVPNQIIKIQIADGSIFSYPMNSIAKVTKETPDVTAKSDYDEDNDNNEDNVIDNDIDNDLTIDPELRPRFKAIVGLNYAITMSDGDVNEGAFNTVFIGGVQFNPYFSVGTGVGIYYQNTTYSNSHSTMIPVFADFRGYFSNKRIAPYFSMDVGYLFDVTNDFTGVGLFLCPTFGVNFKVEGKFAFFVGMNYKLQFYNNNYSVLHNSGIISPTFGFSF